MEGDAGRSGPAQHHGEEFLMSKHAPLEVSVSRTIDAPADAVYDLLSDVTTMGRYSPENTGAEWLDRATGPAVGARFKGTNRIGSMRWSTKPTITAADRGRLFEFEVPGRARATWTYRFDPVPGGVRVTESVRQDRATPFPIRLLQRRAGVTDRAEHLRAGIATTLDRVAAAAERHTVAQ
jgi:uncharacterized protein YndB with AHSA1/START domain